MLEHELTGRSDMLKGLDKIFLDKARTTPFDPLIHHRSRPASDTESPSPRMPLRAA
ncbi:hypothetical protein PSTT_02730 [Puccinia striiformis]|uniref:Uncharacterized protein n=1 Tax=Puccinia striiformis TaxID=27350 RepID=A0A2S4VZ66_9BASI|nr:hypothetical protein PSTT_02730 [Puccinia striiformis]